MTKTRMQVDNEKEEQVRQKPIKNVQFGKEMGSWKFRIFLKP